MIFPAPDQPSIGSYISLSLPVGIQTDTSIPDIALPVPLSSGLPVRLKIPKITVDAALESVGLTSEGAMDVPKNLGDAAWFNRGVRPGEKGSAVIDGHFGWKNGIPAVFNNLYTLRKGDKIYIESEKGATIAFVVQESRTYKETEDAGAVFGSSDGKAHLNLITCKGWDESKQSFSHRLVVFTDKQE